MKFKNRQENKVRVQMQSFCKFTYIKRFIGNKDRIGFIENRGFIGRR